MTSKMLIFIKTNKIKRRDDNLFSIFSTPGLNVSLGIYRHTEFQSSFHTFFIFQDNRFDGSYFLLR